MNEKSIDRYFHSKNASIVIMALSGNWRTGLTMAKDDFIFCQTSVGARHL